MATKEKTSERIATFKSWRGDPRCVSESLVQLPDAIVKAGAKWLGHVEKAAAAQAKSAELQSTITAKRDPTDEDKAKVVALEVSAGMEARRADALAEQVALQFGDHVCDIANAAGDMERELQSERAAIKEQTRSSEAKNYGKVASAIPLHNIEHVDIRNATTKLTEASERVRLLCSLATVVSEKYFDAGHSNYTQGPGDPERPDFKGNALGVLRQLVA